MGLGCDETSLWGRRGRMGLGSDETSLWGPGSPGKGVDFPGPVPQAVYFDGEFRSRPGQMSLRDECMLDRLVWSRRVCPWGHPWVHGLGRLVWP